MDDEEYRWQLFQQVMAGSSDAFVEKAGHFFYNETKLRLVPMPWDENPGAQYTESKTKQQYESNAKAALDAKVKAKAAFDAYEAKVAAKTKVTVDPWSGIQSKTVDTTVTKQPSTKDHSQVLGKDVKWVPVLDAPVVKTKAYNPISLHIPKGAVVKVKTSTYSNVMKEGKVTGFTKLYCKVQFVGSYVESKVAYSKVVSIAQ